MTGTETSSLERGRIHTIETSMNTGNAGPPYCPSENGSRNGYGIQATQEGKLNPKVNLTYRTFYEYLATSDVSGNLSCYYKPLSNSSVGFR